MKKIEVYRADGTYVTTYDSVKETSEKIGYSLTYVSKKLKKDGRVGDYILKYYKYDMPDDVELVKGFEKYYLGLSLSTMTWWNMKTETPRQPHN